MSGQQDLRRWAVPLFPRDPFFLSQSDLFGYSQPTPQPRSLTALSVPSNSFNFDEVDLSQNMIEPDAVASPHAVGANSSFFRGSIDSEGSVSGGFASSTAEFIGFNFHPTELENSTAIPVQGYWQRRGKCSAKSAIRQFLVTGFTKYGGKTITSQSELVQHFDSQLICSVARSVKQKREWWENMANWGKAPVSAAPSRPVYKQWRQLSTISYNICTAYDRLELVLWHYQHIDVIFLQGTRFSKKKMPKDGKRNYDINTPGRIEYEYCGFYIVSWGYSTGKCSNHMCGVLIALNKKKFNRDSIIHRFDPPYNIAGRFGSLRIKNQADNEDLILENAYAPQEEAETQTKDMFWHHVSSAHNSYPARCALIAAGDYNGDLRLPFICT